MKNIFLFSLFFAGSCCMFALKEGTSVNMSVKWHETYYELNKQKEKVPKRSKKKSASICPAEPDGFYDFFGTTFIDFSSLRKGENVTTFSFRDSLCSPLCQTLKITSNFGMRNGQKHFGVDFRLNTGDTVRSIFCGKVRIAKWDESYGYVVVVRHYNMSEAVYAHLDKILVVENQAVEVGQVIGLGGNTGRSNAPHLHFELRYKGFPINPIVNGKFLARIPVGNKP
jgi:murein DD-endopeptidase MepM/ murein hydrolase activator NlpD